MTHRVLKPLKSTRGLAAIGWIVGLSLCASCLTATPDPAPTNPQEGPTVSPTASAGIKKLTLEPFAFIAGRWIGRSETGLLEEIWTEPEGDAMIGLFRMVGGGEARFYEFQNLSIVDGTAVLKIKHFGADLVGWEAKDESTVFTLDTLSENQAVFREEGAEVPTTLHFERAGDRLTITLRKIRDGEARDSTFQFRREAFPLASEGSEN